MKKTILTLLSVLFCAITFAQTVPQGINYQAVARDANGDVDQVMPAYYKGKVREEYV